MQTEVQTLVGATAGTRREVVLCRFGRAGTGPKVYLQAGLHADEMPGVLVLQHLIPLLEAEEAAGGLRGEVLVVPLANPLGLSQWAQHRPLGRHEAEAMKNFNRGFPELAPLVEAEVAESLTEDADLNRDRIRAAFRAALAALAPRSEMEELQVALMRWSCDADYVLDLHCDQVATLHLYAGSTRSRDTVALCRATGAKLALIQDISGGQAFDEAHTVPWLTLAERFGARHPIPNACFAATMEYRGQGDVSQVLAEADARGLMDFLAEIGVAGCWPGRPRHGDAVHLPLGGSAEVFAPQGGVVSWEVAVGAWVEPGQVLGHVTEPIQRRRMALVSPVAGLMFRRVQWHACLRGQTLGHVAGAAVVRRGHLLPD
jgi:uncharacterized protein